MGEIRTMHTVLGAIFGIDAWNNALRAGPKELQDWLGWLMFGDSDAGGGVVGFGATVTDTLEVTVVRGGGLIYTADAPSPASKWAWVYLGEDTPKAIGSHDPSLARYDLISVSWTQNTDTAVSVGYEGGAPASTNTQRGCQATLTVTEGTAHADPWANKPATPTGHEALWYVYVPASSGSVTLVDVRRHLPGPKYRPDDAPMTSVTDVDTDANMAEVLARKAQQDDTAFLSSMRWDVTEDLPYIVRGKGGTGEATDDLYPMVVPAGRTWWRSVPWVGACLRVDDPTKLDALPSDGNGLQISRTSAGASIVAAYVNIPVDVRGVELVAAKLRYKTTALFDATVGAGGRAAKLIHMAADGTDTELATADLTIASTYDGCATPVTFTLSDTPVFAEGDTLFARFLLELTASGGATAGELELHGVDVQFKEARE